MCLFYWPYLFLLAYFLLLPGVQISIRLHEGGHQPEVLRGIPEVRKDGHSH
jgi:hypothetical protein